MKVEHVHFHEVGAIDSIADIVGTAVAWDSLGIAAAYAAPVPVGSGQITIAHGRVSVPAPATAEILRGIPIEQTDIQAELTTPTGAAILAELVTGFGSLPSMQVERIGYGAGTRDLKARPNMLRVLVGEAIRQPSRNAPKTPEIVVMETNLDDATGEEIGFAVERLFESNALDVFTTPIQMKKGRPAVVLTVLANPEDQRNLEAILFRHTSTLGIRYSTQQRSVLPRRDVTVKTELGLSAVRFPNLGTTVGGFLRSTKTAAFWQPNITCGWQMSINWLVMFGTRPYPLKRIASLNSLAIRNLP